MYLKYKRYNLHTCITIYISCSHSIEFYRYILDEYCAARRTALVGSFIDALTLGEGFGGTPNPIEMHANDPKRYISDMLAWLHQAIPVEKENILTLMKGCDKAGKN